MARRPAQARAQQLRQQAEQTTDPHAAIGLLRAAMAAAPSDPWARLDLARRSPGRGRWPRGRR